MTWLMTSIFSHCAKEELISMAPETMSELLIRVAMAQHKADGYICVSGQGIHRYGSARRRAGCVRICTRQGCQAGGDNEGC